MTRDDANFVILHAIDGNWLPTEQLSDVAAIVAALCDGRINVRTRDALAELVKANAAYLEALE